MGSLALRLFSSDAFFYVRLRTCAQYASRNEFTCSEHSVRIYVRKKKTNHWKTAFTLFLIPKLVQLIAESGVAKHSNRSCYANLQLFRTIKTIVNLHSMTCCYA